MHSKQLWISTLFWVAVAAASAKAPSRDLTIYFIDVEGGQATLFVTPSGQSVLVDTGSPGDRDAARIVAAAKEAGISSIDHLLITHYHVDHVGGVPTLARKIPIRNFYDHGDTVEHDAAGQKLYDDYQALAAKANRVLLRPGFKLPVKGLDWTVVSAAGNAIDRPLSGAPGAGKPNPACASFKQREVDPTENARSDGSILAFGKLRVADLGDLTWNKEGELVCPVNKLGTVDIFIVSHHGLDLSNSPALVDALRPRVAIMDNGAQKGGAATVWTTVTRSPGIEDLWQLHFAVAGGAGHNSAPNLIANPTESPDSAYEIKLTGHDDGHFEVINERNGYTKKY